MQQVLPAGGFAFFLAAAMALSSCEGQKDAQGGVETAARPEGKPETKTVIAMLPKLINVDYFDTCRRGAMKAAEELGVTLIFNGPTEATAEGQNQFIETWIRQKVQAICIAPNQPKSVRRFVE